MQSLLCRNHTTLATGLCSQPKLGSQPVCSHTACPAISSSKDNSSQRRRTVPAATDSEWAELPVAAPSSRSNSSSGGGGKTSASKRPASTKLRSSTADSSGSSWYEPTARDAKSRSSTPARGSSRSRGAGDDAETRRNSRKPGLGSRQQQHQQHSAQRDSSSGETERDRRTHSSSSSSRERGPDVWDGSSSNRTARRESHQWGSSSSSRDRIADSPWGTGYNSSSSRAADSTVTAAHRMREKKEKKAAALALSNQPCCYGCGAPLQMAIAAAAGYVTPAKYQLKQKHKQLNKVLCVRCSSLCNGAMIPAVEDFTQKAWAQQQAALLQQQQQQAAVDEAVPSDTEYEVAPAAAAGQLELLGKLLVTPDQLRQKISEVRSVRAVVVLLVDLLDASGTLMSKVRDMVGNNPIILVGTKMDLLPPGCKPKDVADWLAEAAARRRLIVTSAHLVSSHTGEGIAAVTSKVCRERKGRDVFVVGAANVGKSAFVRAMLKEMSSMTGGNFDAAAMATSRYLPVESAMPGTTLGLIPLQAFETGGTLYDTPGVHLHHRIPHMLTPGELRLLHPRKRLTAFLPPTPWRILEEQQEQDPEYEQTGQEPKPTDPARFTSSSTSGSGKPQQVSATYLWSGLVRVDVCSAPRSCALVFYSPKTMRVYGLPLLEEGQEVDIELEDELPADNEPSGSSSDGEEGLHLQDSSSGSSRKSVLFCKESVSARGGLVPHSLVVKSPIPTSACLADIAVSGLPGWVGVYAPFSKQDVVLRVWVPRGVEVFLRPPLPCPPPLSPKGAEEPEELLDIGRALAVAEQDQEWEAAKQGLGLESNRKITEQDEEILKMLMFGDETAGLHGIVDLEEAEDDAEDEDGGVDLQELDTNEAGQHQGRLLHPKQLAVRAEQVLFKRRRSSSSSSSKSSSSLAGAATSGRAAAAVEVHAEAEGGPGWVTIPTTAEELGLPAVNLNDDDGDDVGAKSSGRQRRRRPVSRR